MKKLVLLLITVIFSSLLIGCGMRGPLYQAPQSADQQPIAQEPQETEISP